MGRAHAVPGAPLSVLVDGYYLASRRGLGRYIRELLAAVAEHTPEVDLHVAVQAGCEHLLPARSKAHVMSPMPFPVWEQVALPLLIRSLKPQVYHAPYNTWPVVRPHGTRVVVTVHDLIFLKKAYKGMGISQRIGQAYRAIVIGRMLRPDITITTMTREIAREIEARLGRIAQIHRTSIHTFLSLDKAPVAGLPARFLLHVGGTSSQKNSARVIRAFRDAGADGGALVVAGIDANNLIAQENASANVIFPGWLTDEQMAYLYANAAAVLFPSLMEGFGLPVVEGMATTGVVITSNRAPMSELAGDAALLVDPESEAEISAAILRVWNDGGLRADLKARAHTRAEDFSQPAMAKALLRVYAPSHTDRNG